MPRRSADTGPMRADRDSLGGKGNPVAYGTDHNLADRDVVLGLTLHQADTVIRRAGLGAAEEMVERSLARRGEARARRSPLSSTASDAAPDPTTAPDANAPRQERRAHPRTVTVTGVR
jgi:hypothetical protein